jgi:transcriptional regulator with XRE-family HTH domain
MYPALKPVEETDTFGSVIRECRHRVGLTQRDVAERVGVNYTYICKVEKDALPAPSEATIERLAELYGVLPDYLMMFSRHVPKSLKRRLETAPLAFCRLVTLLGTDDLTGAQIDQMLRIAQVARIDSSTTSDRRD